MSARNASSPPPDFLLGRDLLSQTGAMRRLRRQRSCPDPIEKRNLRISIGLVLVCFGFAAIILRLGYVMAPWESQESNLPLPVRAIAESTAKPIITDRNGNILAMDLPAYSLYAKPQRMRSVREDARRLAAVFPDTIPHLANNLARAIAVQEKFVWIARYVSPREARAAMDLGIVGVEVMRTERRSHPFGSLAAHITGFTDIDGYGLAGAEKIVTDRIQAGGTQIRGTQAGRIHSEQGEQNEQGEHITLSIDLRVQHALEKELSATMTHFSGAAAAGIVMNARNGEILAMVSLPNFHPDKRDMLNEENRFNRATLGVYEFGSVFKPFTYATALEATPRNQWPSLFASHYSTAPLRIPGYTITDFRPKHSQVNFAQGMVYSSNVATAKIMRRIGAETLKNKFEQFGMAQPAPLEISERGLPQTPKKWGPTESVTVSYGHGIAVSPLHVVRAIAAVVNGGILPTPTLLKQTDETQSELPKGQRVLSPEVSAVMRRFLRLVVIEGTGRKANAPGYLVGGKTGTANQVSPNGGYDKDLRIASFVSAFPMNDPKYITFMMVEKPKPSEDSYGYATGGWVSASATRPLIERIAPILGVLPQDNVEFDEAARLFLHPPAAPAVPDTPKIQPETTSLVVVDAAVDAIVDAIVDTPGNSANKNISQPQPQIQTQTQSNSQPDFQLDPEDSISSLIRLVLREGT
ncbi:MAG: penicillin-binding protein 2 [Alphaproteobacteria bacterium]